MSGRFIRVIKRRETLALAFGAMVGWSWVALTGDWIGGAGSAGAVLAFVVGGIAVTFVGLTYAELAAAMPQAGGEHVYSARALGATASFICTWAILLGYVSVVAFEAVALPTVVEYLLPGFSRGYLWSVGGWDVQATWVLVGVVAAVVMTAINVLGIRTAARLQFLATTLVGVTGILLALGAAVNGELDNANPAFAPGIAGFTGVLIMVPFMFLGFDVIPQSRGGSRHSIPGYRSHAHVVYRPCRVLVRPDDSRGCDRPAGGCALDIAIADRIVRGGGHGR